MERTYINEAQKAIGSTVKVQGFIENLRNSKYMAFIVLKDITGKLQITVEKEDHPDLVDTIDQLTPDSVITVTGKVVENDYVKMGGVEMIPESIEIESIANALPIVRKEIAATKKKKAVERSSIDQRIDYRWIDLRTDENQLMFKAQSCFVNAMRKFLLDRNFIEIHTPKLIAAASESGSEVFKVDYFDRNAYLAQSPQFYKQMAMAAGFERIFETGPVFRAEKSYTNKHSTEFSGSSSLNAIGTCVSTPPIPTIAGILSVMSSMPYSPCIIADTGRIERSLRTIHSQIRFTDIAIP